MEVHQNADTKVAHSEVGEKLGLMGWQKCGDGLDFENDGVFDNDIGAKTQWNGYAFVNDRHCALAFEADAGMSKFHSHSLGIH